MRSVSLSATILVFLASTINACSSAADSPTSPSSVSGATALTADQLAGAWQVVSIRLAGQAEQPRPAGAPYTLTFNADRLATRVDCNSCSGGYTISGATIIVFDAMACTRAACPTMAYENQYTGLLSGDHSVTVAAGSMVWVSSRGTIRFTR